MNIERGQSSWSYRIPTKCETMGKNNGSGPKQRAPVSSNNVVEKSTLTLNERILKECHTLYTDPEGDGCNGLVGIAEVKLF